MDRHAQLILVGKTIRRLREETGLSQENFAAKVEMDRSNYGKVERGERNVTTLKLIRIADTLGVEVGDLLPKMKELKRRKKKTSK